MSTIPSGNKAEVELGIELYGELGREIDAVGGRTACRQWPGLFTSPQLDDARGIALAAELVEACTWCPVLAKCALIADALPESQRGSMVLGGQQFNLSGTRVLGGGHAADAPAADVEEAA
ncbi:hypothetical protein E0H75_42100 [Kribbella capetownensis]|uniref:4Fe-4S Wbl-type domain-containing protein n=1 Tax=Kribbella capetownensis TaxID=1572659 RepID=A0A4R0IYE1_9ACTN|nr:hypothetical protein [Kribbella capetownensis]TCC33855.1 hypothetical protein E0H75_42100 [Kribbella capetownensis]